MRIVNEYSKILWITNRVKLIINYLHLTCQSTYDQALVFPSQVRVSKVKMLGVKACNMCEGTHPQRHAKVSSRRADGGKDIQHFTWDRQCVARQPVPATGPEGSFN